MAAGVESVIVAKQALVGRIIADKALNINTEKAMISKGWGDPEDLNIIDTGVNTFLFNFNDDALRNKILEDSPWNVLGYILCLQRWILEITM